MVGLVGVVEDVIASCLLHGVVRVMSHVLMVSRAGKQRKRKKKRGNDGGMEGGGEG